jgi:hypothetical protein
MGIFLHTAWRSRGTWAWEALRSQPGNLGFYEPLHEHLPSMSTRRINALHDGNWQSGHPALAQPYFAEYAPLLRASLVPGYRRTLPFADTGFAFDRYFLAAGEPHDALRRYIASLCDTAAASGCQPVIKFARSQGRFAWFAANFPSADHVLLVRQPWAQFCSGWRCFAGDNNPYFVAAPFLVLERNAAHGPVAALIAALDLPAPPAGRPAHPSRRLKHWLRAVWSIEPVVLYRAMFSLWLLSLSHALPAAAAVLDADAPAAETAARLGITQLRPKLVSSAHAPAPRISLASVRHCHAAGLMAITPHIGPQTRHRIQAWLNAAEAQAAAMLAVDSPHARPVVLPPRFDGERLPYGPPAPLI